MMLEASGPTATGTALIVGCAVATLAATYALIGNLATRLWSRLDRQDSATEAIDRGQLAILDKLTLHDERLKAVEKGHRRHRKIFDRLTWIIEMQEAGNGHQAPTLPAMPAARKPPDRNRPRKARL